MSPPVAETDPAPEAASLSSAAEAATPPLAETKVGPQVETRIEQRGPGIVPLALASLVSAALGAGGAIWYLGQGQSGPDLAALEARFAALETRPAADPAALEAAITASLAPRLEALEAGTPALPGLETRIAALETGLPGAEALQNRIAGLESELNARIEAAVGAATQGSLAELERRQNEASADLAAGADAVERQRAAAETAEAAAGALAALSLAAQTGAPATDALDQLENALAFPRLPGSEALRAGLPSLASLQSEFAPAARAALAAAPADQAEGLVDQALGFLRRQTNARSLAPREGADSDAVLSRGEGALRAGDLARALAELEALPEAPAAAMAPWAARARARLAGLEALETLRAHAAAAAADRANQ